MFYSATSGGFYSHEIHGENIPEDAVEISEQRHLDLLSGQSEGKRIIAGKKGLPELADPAPASAETLAICERVWRDGELSVTDGRVSRHRDEIEAGTKTSLTAEQYSALQAYRQTLRGWTEAKDFPQIAARPVAPEWLNS